MPLTLSRVDNFQTIKIITETKINLKENRIGPFVKSRDYRKAVTAMLWAEMTPDRIDALIGDEEIESSPGCEPNHL